MNWLQGIWNIVVLAWQELKCLLPNLWARFLDVMVTLQEEFTAALLAVLSVIPLPDNLLNFQWPEVGGLGYALAESGLPQAMALLSGALFVRFIKGLILKTR